MSGESAPADASAEARPVILVAEDERSVRELVSLVLRTAGYEPLLCEDGAQAIAALDRGVAVDAVLLDLRMPGASGHEVVAHIRRSDRLSALPVVAMSAYNDELQAMEMLSAGADAFLAKPFTVQELTSTLAAVLGR
jgi:CheY-like chemotaxis protein